MPAGGGFAVVDVETTGLFPGRDRVVEVAVVHLDPGANVTGEFRPLPQPRPVPPPSGGRPGGLHRRHGHQQDRNRSHGHR